jgi:hypothetical protein
MSIVFIYIHCDYLFIQGNAHRFDESRQKKHERKYQRQLSTRFVSKVGARMSLRLVAQYAYRDERGIVQYIVCRTARKEFPVKVPEKSAYGGYRWGYNSVSRIPYRLDEIVASPAKEIIFIVEGEKDADNLKKKHMVATTNPGGPLRWRASFNSYLIDRHVVIIPDNDSVGRLHAYLIAHSLYGTAATVKILLLPNVPPGGDVTDWIKGGGKKKELLKLVRATELWTPVAPYTTGRPQETCLPETFNPSGGLVVETAACSIKEEAVNDSEA